MYLCHLKLPMVGDGFDEFIASLVRKRGFRRDDLVPDLVGHGAILSYISSWWPGLNVHRLPEGGRSYAGFAVSVEAGEGDFISHHALCRAGRTVRDLAKDCGGLIRSPSPRGALAIGLPKTLPGEQEGGGKPDWHIAWMPAATGPEDVPEGLSFVDYADPEIGGVYVALDAPSGVFQRDPDSGAVRFHALTPDTDDSGNGVVRDCVFGDDDESGAPCGENVTELAYRRLFDALLSEMGKDVGIDPDTAARIIASAIERVAFKAIGPFWNHADLAESALRSLTADWPYMEAMRAKHRLHGTAKQPSPPALPARVRNWLPLMAPSDPAMRGVGRRRPDHPYGCMCVDCSEMRAEA